MVLVIWCQQNACWREANFSFKLLWLLQACHTTACEADYFGSLL